MEPVIVISILIVIAILIFGVAIATNKAKNEDNEYEDQKKQIDELLKNKKQNYNNKANEHINETEVKRKYEIKQKYVSNCEQEYFFTIKNIVSPKYIIYPQVPLSQIIEKKSDKTFQNELYRIIDFCIFNTEFKPLICIEINDRTHNEFKRIQRDIKVKEILADAGLPLITLWTEYGINRDYIKKRLSEIIELNEVA